MPVIKYFAILSLALVLGACASTTPAPSPNPPGTTATAPRAAGGSGSSAAPNPALVDAGAIQSLKAMGSALQGLKRYEVSLDLTGERVLQDGQKLMHSATADLQVALPNRIRAVTQTATTHRVLSYDGRRVMVVFPDLNYYSAVDFSGTVGELIDRLRSNYGIEFPAADLFDWGTGAAPVDGIESAMNAGQALVDNVLCDHYAFRQRGIDWQIWLRADGDPLPMKLVVTKLGDEARPQSTTVFHWNLKPGFRDSIFTAAPPAGAKAIDMVPVKNTPR